MTTIIQSSIIATINKLAFILITTFRGLKFSQRVAALWLTLNAIIQNPQK